MSTAAPSPSPDFAINAVNPVGDSVNSFVHQLATFPSGMSGVATIETEIGKKLREIKDAGHGERSLDEVMNEDTALKALVAQRNKMLMDAAGQ